MSKENIENFFAKMDANSSGTITVDELIQEFKKFDKDGSGNLSPSEVSDGLKATLGASPEQSDKCFKALDKNSSGDINIEELQSLFKDIDKNVSGDITKDEFVEFWMTLLK